MAKPKVYFTKDITPENVVRLYEKLGVKLPGKVAVKVHSGEEGNQNYLRPEFMILMVKEVDGTIVECNTAYDGARDTTEKHEKLMAAHGERARAEGEPCGRPFGELRFPLGALPLQRASHGRLRRSAQAALHRVRI